MPHIITDREYNELRAYRDTGLTPEGINKILWDTIDPAPLPLQLNEPDQFAQIEEAISNEQWMK